MEVQTRWLGRRIHW